jgi:hypothetical protein
MAGEMLLLAGQGKHNNKAVVDAVKNKFHDESAKKK